VRKSALFDIWSMSRDGSQRIICRIAPCESGAVALLHGSGGLPELLETFRYGNRDSRTAKTKEFDRVPPVHSFMPLRDLREEREAAARHAEAATAGAESVP
jgi:hypothetical protein